MIQQPIYFTVSTDCEDASSLTWVLTTDDPCLTLSQTTGVIENVVPGQEYILSVTGSAINGNCFNTTIVTLNVTDNLGNGTSYNVNLSNPCTGFGGAVTQQTVGDYPYSFVAAISGGNGTYIYQWSYDESLFNEVTSPGSNILSLELKNNVPLPSSTTVYLTVTDANGCEASYATTATICNPVSTSQTIVLACLPEASAITGCGTVVASNNKVKLTATPCTGRTIDWSTFSWESSDGLCLVETSNNGNDLYANIHALASAAAGSAQLAWTVKDNIGAISGSGIIFTTIPDCPAVEVTTPPIIIEDQLYELSAAELTPGTEIELDIDDFISEKIHVRDSSVQRLDWSSFTFIASTGQTLLTATTMTGLNGAIELTLDHKVKFTVGAVINCNVELIRFEISDGLGNKSNQGRILLDFEPATAPTAVADAECIVCGEGINIDILANDTGDINPGSVQVVTAPTKGSFAIDPSDGSINYVANSNQEGADTIDYKVANPDGRYSNDATVTITIICAGEDNSADNLCLIAGVNLESYLSSWATSGGTWTAQLTNPDFPSLANPTSVDFSSSPSGTYVYFYEVTSGSCTSIATITLTFINASTNDDCTGALVVSYPSVAGETLYNDDELITVCDIESIVSAAAPAGPLQIPPNWNRNNGADLWYRFTTGTSLLTPKLFVDSSAYSNGLVNPQIAVYDNNCGVDTFTLIASAGAGNNARYVELETGALSASTTYYIRVAGGDVPDFHDGTGKFTLGIYHP